MARYSTLTTDKAIKHNIMLCPLVSDKVTDINDTLGSEVDALSEGLQEALDMVDSNRNDSLRLSEAIAEMNNTRLTPETRK